MELDFDLKLVQSQKLLLTPQLKQAIEVLRMNAQELCEFLEEQIQSNPVLEIVEQEEFPEDEENSATQEEQGWEYDFEKADPQEPNDGSFDDLLNDAGDKSTQKPTLKEHLLLQLHTSNLDEAEVRIGEYLVGSLDENGYLLAGVPETAARLNVPAQKVNRALEHIQALEPPGIGARNLKECLLIQLRQMDPVNPHAIDIVSNHLESVGANKIAAVAKGTGLSVERVSEVFDFIKTLEPKPGRAFSNHTEVKYIVPDVIVKEIGAKFEVITNEEAVFTVRVGSYYKKIVSEDISSETRKFVQNKIDSALWLLKCIEQRKNMVRRVAECIVKRQADFFARGKKFVKPLTLKSVARDTELHESTVSRTVHGKYLQCCWGVFELKYFFPGKLAAAGGDEISTESVKIKLKQFIHSEDRRNPISDGALAEALKKDGVEISRRTVAKYRSELGIPAAGKRKKYGKTFGK